MIPFRRQKEAVTTKRTTCYHDPDGDDEALDALLGLCGKAALNQKRSEINPGQASEAKDGTRKRNRTPPPDETSKQ